jgi:hypothetical protein
MPIKEVRPSRHYFARRFHVTCEQAVAIIVNQPRGTTLSSSRDEIRVALISSHPLCRDGFKQALRANRHMVPIEGVRAADAVAIARERRADVLLIDVQDLPGGSMEIVHTLARDYRNPPPGTGFPKRCHSPSVL